MKTNSSDKTESRWQKTQWPISAATFNQADIMRESAFAAS
jgi:hypothetical protein